jgi:tetratricopeptide (TPR) repeat protein
VAAYEAILSESPGDALALQRLAALQWSRGRLREALEMASRLVKTPTGAVNGHTILAEVYHDSGETEKAVEHFRRVDEIDPDLRQLVQPHLIFWLEFGDDLLRLGLPTEARRVLTNAARQIEDAALMDLLGRAFLDEGNPTEAERCWLKSLDKAPERIQPWLLLGKVSLQNQKTDDALPFINRALDIDPNNYEALTMAGAAHRALGHVEEARAYRTRAERARRSRAPAATGMGADTTPSKP